MTGSTRSNPQSYSHWKGVARLTITQKRYGNYFYNTPMRGR